MSAITATGNLTKDPELRFLPNGTERATFDLADNRRRPNGNGGFHESVSYYPIVAFGSLAANISESIKRGDRVMVSGRLEQRTIERQDGQKYNVLEIVADDIAPSLKWATAEVTRNPKNTNSSSRSQAQPATGGYEEEPF